MGIHPSKAMITTHAHCKISAMNVLITEAISTKFSPFIQIIFSAIRNASGTEYNYSKNRSLYGKNMPACVLLRCPRIFYYKIDAIIHPVLVGLVYTTINDRNHLFWFAFRKQKNTSKNIIFSRLPSLVYCILYVAKQQRLYLFYNGKSRFTKSFDI